MLDSLLYIYFIVLCTMYYVQHKKSVVTSFAQLDNIHVLRIFICIMSLLKYTRLIQVVLIFLSCSLVMHYLKCNNTIYLHTHHSSYLSSLVARSRSFKMHTIKFVLTILVLFFKCRLLRIHYLLF